jgi:hypothetical protein
VRVCTIFCRCETVGFPLQQLHFQQGVAEELPIEDCSQDAVIGTLVSPLQGIYYLLPSKGCCIYLLHTVQVSGSAAAAALPAGGC